MKMIISCPSDVKLCHVFHVDLLRSMEMLPSRAALVCGLVGKY